MAVSKKMEPQEKSGYLQPYDSWNNRIAIHEFVKDLINRKSRITQLIPVIIIGTRADSNTGSGGLIVRTSSQFICSKSNPGMLSPDLTFPLVNREAPTKYFTKTGLRLPKFPNFLVSQVSYRQSLSKKNFSK
jgi:hypothetical protein